MDYISQPCLQCIESGYSDCMICPLGNPCLGCEDYDQINHTCKSNGGCAPERDINE